MHKRGLSDVVVAVLIILLAIASVVLIWLFLKPFFTNSIENAVPILTSITIIRDSVVNSQLNQNLTFLVQKDSGDNNISSFNVVLKDITGNSRSFNNSASLNQLYGSVRISVNYAGSGLSNLSSLSVYPVFIINGREILATVPATYDFVSGLTVSGSNIFGTPSSGGSSGGGGGGGSGGSGGNGGNGGNTQGSTGNPISGCGTISVAGSYVLQNDITSATSPCIEITGNNIVFDGAGHKITMSGSSSGTQGISLYAASNNIVNNIVLQNYASGVVVLGNNNLISNINLINDSLGIAVQSYFASGSMNNVITNITASNIGAGGIVSLSGSNGLKNTSFTKISNVNGNGSASGNGILLNQVFDTSINNVNLVSIGGRGFSLFSSTNNYISNVNVLGNGTYGLHLRFNSYNDTLVNVTTRGLSTGLYIETGGNYKFVNLNSYGNINSQIIDNPQSNFVRYENQNGQIVFLNLANLNVPSTHNITFPGAISIATNNVSIDTTNLPEFNKAANITLYGLPTNFVNPRIMKNGAICTDCYNFTSLNAGTVIFNVSSSGRYNVG